MVSRILEIIFESPDANLQLLNHPDTSEYYVPILVILCTVSRIF